MVPLLKKLYIAACAALFVTFAGSVSLELNDSGTWRLADEVYVNDSGTWRAIEQIEHNDSGVWRTSYHASITTVTVGNQNPFFGFANPNYSPVSGSAIADPNIDVPVAGTIIVLLDDTGLDVVQLHICTAAVVTQTSFSRLIMYDTTGTSYVELQTASASLFQADLNVTSNCTTLPADGGSFDQYQWRWSGVSDFWTAADVGGTRKILLVR